MRTLTVPSGVEPMRLDAFLASQVPDCSRRAAQRAIAAGTIRINGRRARKGDRVGGGDVVHADEALFAPPSLQPNPRLAVPVLYEDAAVIALDKPAGLPAHALRPDETDTIANFLLARYPGIATIGKTALEPGIVHRLDTDTSGILLAARTPQAYEALRQQFAAHQVTKEYAALVAGDVGRRGEVRLPIAHHGRDRRRMRIAASDDRHARPALTSYRPLERFGDATLLAVQIPTGVRHQIRVHLAAIGHAVLGDRLYAPPPIAGAAERHLLHARRVVFVHPGTGAPVRVTSALAADFERVLETLRHTQAAGEKSGKAN
jgi:23S rRNA pseudouridine1911/1915/1917 synthase